MIKRIILTIASAMALLLPAMVPAIASAQDANINASLCKGASLDVQSTGNCEPEDTQGKVNDLITTVINVLSIIVGLVAVIMIIVGGLRYITSGGESSNITGAKNTILYAIVGLIVVALAQVLVKFVIGKTNGV